MNVIKWSIYSLVFLILGFFYVCFAIITFIIAFIATFFCSITLFGIVLFVVIWSYWIGMQQEFLGRVSKELEFTKKLLKI